jgi:hypothetical protein
MDNLANLAANWVRQAEGRPLERLLARLLDHLNEGSPAAARRLQAFGESDGKRKI